MRRLLLLVAFVFCLVAVELARPVFPANASAGRDASYKIAKVDKPPAFDFALTDPEWQQGIVATDFMNLTTRKAAALTTTAYMVYDAQNIYVAIKCAQTGVRITATQTTNNVGYGVDDWAGVGFDTSGNGTREYDFYVTPRGTRYQQSTESARYNPPWEAHAIVRGDVWVAEFIIPLRDMRTTGGKLQSWRFSFARQLAESNETYTWAFDPRMGGAGDSTYWPALTDIEVPSGTGRARPYADVYALSSTGRDRKLFEEPNLGFAPATIRNYGVDVNFPFTNSLSFDGTLAPDFSNVEIDQQIIAPQEFARQLTEYRPFFSQGAAFLTPGLGDNISGPDTFASLFNSPDIGEFNRGLKIEGTQGLTALGVLEAAGNGFDDVAYGFNHRGSDQSWRYFADGVIANHTGTRDISYQFGGRKSNLVSGFETGFEYAGETGTFVPDASLAHYYDAYADVNKPNYTAFAGYHALGPYFAPLDGFTPINDIKGPFGFLAVNGAGHGGSRVQTFNLFAGAERYLDYGGNVHDEDAQYSANVTFKNQLNINAGATIGTLRTYPDNGAGYPTYANATTLPFNQTGVGINYRGNLPTGVGFGYTWGAFATLCPAGPPAPLFCTGPSLSNWVDTYDQGFQAVGRAQLSDQLTLELEYDGSFERPFALAAPADSQFLRRITLGESLGSDANAAISLRSITGTGGFALPGLNLAVSIHKKFVNGNEVFVAFGTPAAAATLDRMIVKYIWHIGSGGAGT